MFSYNFHRQNLCCNQSHTYKKIFLNFKLNNLLIKATATETDKVNAVYGGAGDVARGAAKGAGRLCQGDADERA